MITINGTPLNDLARQVLALEHIVTNIRTQERRYNNNRVELILDDQKIREVLEPIRPRDVSVTNMFHGLIHLYGRDISRISARSSDNPAYSLRSHFNGRTEDGQIIPLFPQASKTGDLSIIFTTSSKSVQEMVEVLGVRHGESVLVRKEEGCDPVKCDFWGEFLGEVAFPGSLSTDTEPYSVELYDPMTVYNCGHPLSLYSRNGMVDAAAMTLEFDFYDGARGSWNLFDDVFRRLIKNVYGIAPFHLADTKSLDISYGYSLDVRRISPKGYDDIHVSLSFSDRNLFERVARAFSFQFQYPDILQSNGKRADPAPK